MPGSLEEIFRAAVQHHQAGRLDEAIAGYRAAIETKADCVEAYCNLGMALASLGQIGEAQAAFERAIELRPAFVEAHNNLGNVLITQGRLADAVMAFARAIQIKPGYAEAHVNLAGAQLARNQLDTSIESSRRAIALRPDIPQAYTNLGIALKDTGRIAEAMEAFRRAVQIKPDYVEAYGNLLLTAHYEPNLTPQWIFSQHRAWAKRYAEPFAREIQPLANDRSPGRRLRVGYISADFRRHPVGYFILPLLENHDHRQFEIFCYANVPGPDVVTESAKQSSDVWRNILGASDADVARQVRADGVDILVDLTGHTSSSRLLVFARKPAPVQVTYLGYPNTTGLQTMDYRLTDSMADPPGMTDGINTEKLWRLDGCAWCYEPHAAMPEIAPRGDGPVTFGCFNAFAKINELLVRMWADAMRSVPGSRLLLKSAGAGETSSRKLVHGWFEHAGVSADRIEMIGQVGDPRAHFEFYNRVDVALDTSPYHGTTTTCEALWMGAPVVTLAGQAHVSRVGVSLLGHVGLPELVAETSGDFVRIAAEWATDGQRRRAFRESIRRRMRESPLMDARRFAADVEHAYWQMWEGWCARQ